MQEQPFDRAGTAKERFRHTDAGKQRTRQTVPQGPSSCGLAMPRSVIGARSLTVTAVYARRSNSEAGS